MRNIDLLSDFPEPLEASSANELLSETRRRQLNNLRPIARRFSPIGGCVAGIAGNESDPVATCRDRLAQIDNRLDDAAKLQTNLWNKVHT